MNTKVRSQKSEVSLPRRSAAKAVGQPKERPILFSGEMVRAILEGRKTQTRRIMNPQPSAEWCPSHFGEIHKLADYGFKMRNGAPIVIGFGFCNHAGDEGYVSKHGTFGDQLWVREAFYQFGHWEKVDGVKTKTGRTKWKFVADESPAANEYLFDPPSEYRKGRHHKDPGTPFFHKRLARFMPRKASRINLEVVSIRVERLQDISEAGAIAEGIESCHPSQQCSLVYRDYRQKERDAFEWFSSPIDSYQSLWESINGNGSWAKNPWVWVVEFRRLTSRLCCASARQGDN